MKCTDYKCEQKHCPVCRDHNKLEHGFCSEQCRDIYWPKKKSFDDKLKELYLKAHPELRQQKLENI